MSETISRSVIDGLLPKGAAWDPTGDFDLLLEGVADNSEPQRIFLNELSILRDPQFTTLLSDLEKEYGIIPDSLLSDQVRRDRLESVKTATQSTGTHEYLQGKLTAAGFVVLVHVNNPPVDPDTFLNNAFQMVAGGSAAFAGNADAFCGRVGGGLVVNGDIFDNSPDLDTVCSGDTSYAGNVGAYAGSYLNNKQELITYPTPTEDYWPLVFFIGGAATRNGSGELTAIASASVLATRREELIRIIIKYKPLHSWAGIVITFI